MAQLKRCFMEAPALISISYKKGVGLIILAIDASLEGWDTILIQKILGKRKSTRYKSGP